MLWFKCSEIIPGVSIGIATIVVAIAGVFAYLEFQSAPGVDYACRMADSAAENIAAGDSVTPVDKAVFIVGHTGESGKALVKYIDENKVFTKVRLIGRRKVELDLKNPDIFEQVVIDFDKLDEHADAFSGSTVGYCALGTTRGQSGHDGFIKVDHDYVVKIGELSKAGGCKEFSIVSSVGANKNSTFLYPRTKGQVEEALKVFLFDRLSIFRPALLLVKREKSRFFESLGQLVMKPITYVFPTAGSIPIPKLAQAMVLNTLATPEQPVEMYENKAIHAIVDGKCAKK